MANFLDKLKNFIQARDIKLSLSFTLVNIHKNDSSKKILILNKAGEVEKVNLGALDKKRDKEFAELFTQAESGTLFLNEGTNKLIESTKETLAESVNKSLIDFFIGKIPPDDLRILKSAIVLRKQFKEGRDISDYKHQLSEIYGSKANTICNMCTAGYFENFLIPLYETMSKGENFKIEDFTVAYMQLIQDFPIAIFINSSTSLEDLERIIRDRIESNKRYEISYLNIHGIGRSNINAISAIVAKLSKPGDYTQKNIDEKDGIIIVKLRFD